MFVAFCVFLCPPLLCVCGVGQSEDRHCLCLWLSVSFSVRLYYVCVWSDRAKTDTVYVCGFLCLSLSASTMCVWGRTERRQTLFMFVAFCVFLCPPLLCVCGVGQSEGRHCLCLWLSVSFSVRLYYPVYICLIDKTSDIDHVSALHFSGVSVCLPLLSCLCRIFHST